MFDHCVDITEEMVVIFELYHAWFRYSDTDLVSCTLGQVQSFGCEIKNNMCSSRKCLIVCLKPF